VLSCSWRTPEGRRAFDAGRERIAAIESRWRSELGAERWKALQSMLRELKA
jgi:hypothetical protein